MITKCQPERGTFLRYRRLEDGRIYYVASKILYFLFVFKTETLDDLIYESDTCTLEEVLEHICDTLIESGDSFDELCNFLDREADDEDSTLGIVSQRNHLARKQFAANILSDIEWLYTPLDIKIGPPEDF